MLKTPSTVRNVYCHESRSCKLLCEHIAELITSIITNSGVDRDNVNASALNIFGKVALNDGQCTV